MGEHLMDGPGLELGWMAFAEGAMGYQSASSSASQ